MRKLTGYQIQTKDGHNAHNDDDNQAFKTIEEARNWAEAIWERTENVNKEFEYEEYKIKKEDFVIVYFEEGVERNTFSLFVD